MSTSTLRFLQSWNKSVEFLDTPKLDTTVDLDSCIRVFVSPIAAMISPVRMKVGQSLLKGSSPSIASNVIRRASTSSSKATGPTPPPPPSQNITTPSEYCTDLVQRLDPDAWLTAHFWPEHVVKPQGLGGDGVSVREMWLAMRAFNVSGTCQGYLWGTELTLKGDTFRYSWSCIKFRLMSHSQR